MRFFLQDWALYRVSHSKDFSSLSCEEIQTALKGKDNVLIPLSLNSLPWITIQRPGNRYHLYFQKVEVVLAQKEANKKKGKKLKEAVFISSESEVCVCVCVDFLFCVYITLFFFFSN